MATLVNETEHRLPDAEALGRWIIQQGLDGNAASTVFEGFCGQILAGGIPI